jgi:hypothetical protein
MLAGRSLDSEHEWYVVQVRALLLLIPLAPACSLLVSLDDLGGSDASDVVTTDVPPSPDVTTDAMMDVSADTAVDARFCATQALADGGVTFCDDFDTPDAVAFATWSTVVENGGGSASIIASNDSPPNAAHFHDPGYDGGGADPQCAITKTFLTAATSSITYQFDLRVEAYPSSGAISLSPVKPDQTKPQQLYFSLDSTTAAYAELIDFSDGGTFYNQWTLSQRPMLNVWMHVEVDLTVASPMTVTVYLDEQLAMTANTPLDPRFTAAMPNAAAGITFIDVEPTAAIVDVDNVLIQFH